MAVELQALAGGVILAILQLVLFAVPANREIGSGYLAGPRDKGIPPLSPLTGRLQRAFLNQIEALALFTPAVVVVVLGDASSALTEAAALVWLAARIVYVPLYAFGVPWIRSAVWAVGLLAVVAMLAAALLA